MTIFAPSIYFNGSTTSYLSIPANSSLNFGTGTFTIEWYQNMEAGNSWPRVFDNESIMVSIEGGQFYFWINGTPYGLGDQLTNYTYNWVHFAITRDSSNTIRAFRDGGLLGTITNNTTDFTSNSNLYIGKKSGTSNNGECFKGYLVYFRWIKGECLYNSAFTPHLSLLTKQPFGVYSAENYASNAIPEFSNTSGMGVVCNSVSQTSASGHGATASIPYVYGTTSSTMEWPSGSIPSTFTICSTTRHNGGTRGRVLQGLDINFVHGNYLGGTYGTRGIAYYNTGVFITSDQNQDTADELWLVMCGKVGTAPGNIYYDGATRGINTSATFNTQGKLAINGATPYPVDNGSFAFSNVMIWDQALTDAEMVSVYDVLNDYLATGGTAGKHFNQIALTTETNVSLLLLANDSTYKGTMGGNVTESNVSTGMTNIDFSPSPPCFLEGTQIAILRDGVETLVNVEDLRPGDLVNTYKHGPKAIKIIGKRTCQNDKTNPHSALYKVQKTESMTDDLYISGGHGLLKDEAPRGLQFKIDDKYIHFAHQCCEHVDDRRMCTYYNFCMEGDKDHRYGVWANGVLCETPSESQLSTFGLILLQ